MLEASAFTDFVGRIRAGDEQAAADLVRQYEPLIRREVRLRLEDKGLCRLFDSMDVCQSVLASFFLRTAAGQYDLESPPQLVKLLVTMARHKLASAARRQRRHKRDHRKAVGGHDVLDQVVCAGPSPSEHIAGKELLERVRAELSDEERRVAELRGQGLGWPEIADRLGGRPQARRMQLARALDRAARLLGLEEGSDE
jgi:RNA polymerase sigma factor (sigma-70 family)